jgi:LPXTG-site transpeptidase (sortase) family protein
VSLYKVNSVLLAIIILLNCYVIAAPFIPSLIFSLQAKGKQHQQLSRQIDNIKSGTSVAGSESGNRVIIPAMLLNQPILEGSIANQYKTLNSGIWHWPNAGSPATGGNTVLIGHRFTYTNPRGVFYFLNKVSLGDLIGVYWNSKQYLYKVVSTQVVQPNDKAVENNTVNPELTLFTCTPLLLPKDRLVVVADLEKS